ncbi:hypothetical protein J4Q44_G00371780 [Coregonus suidteri]|uniref:Uncharacterized protein n=1 Tax=Coregonus suidteri TaxID=861788 RepID=A0AAN8Q5S2_9TELE
MDIGDPFLKSISQYSAIVSKQLGTNTDTVRRYSTRDREEHSCRRRRGAVQWEREKDSQTKDYLFQFAATNSKQKISTNSIFGTARESRARSFDGTHANTGKDLVSE